jgi:hypothetical protein
LKINQWHIPLNVPLIDRLSLKVALNPMSHPEPLGNREPIQSNVLIGP